MIDTPLAHARRRRVAIKRAEREANRFADWLIARGGSVPTAAVADYYGEVKANELAALEQRERRAMR